MTCVGCETKIENKLRSITGISSVEADFVKGIVDVEFDFNIINLESIIEIINSLGYKVVVDNDNSNARKDLLKSIVIFVMVALIIILISVVASSTVDGFNPLDLTTDAGFIAVFLFGLITSLHCVGMCGGVQLAVCASSKSESNSKHSKLKPTIQYNLGRVISYTLVGAVLGSIGATVVTSIDVGGSFRIIIGALMILMGLGMLTKLPFFQKVIPRMPKLFGNKINDKIGKSGPFIVGLLMGLRPCGPLQTAQIYALGTASLFFGAFAMFLFAISTVPIMFAFGLISSSLNQRFADKLVIIGAAIVIFMGINLFILGISLI